MSKEQEEEVKNSPWSLGWCSSMPRNHWGDVEDTCMVLEEADLL